MGGGTNKFFVPGGQTFLTQLGGEKHFLVVGGANIFLHRGEKHIFRLRGGGQTFSYGQDNDTECERSEHSFVQSREAPCMGSEILV